MPKYGAPLYHACVVDHLSTQKIMSTVMANAHWQARAVLTPEQIADRDAVIADHPTPEGARHGKMPSFMGWNRPNCTFAPDAVVDYFGMRTAVDAWRRDWDELLVSISLPPEFDRGELLRRWQSEQKQRAGECEARGL